MKSFLRAAQAGRAQVLEESKVRTSYPTIGRVFELYREAGEVQFALDGKPLPGTIANNIWALSHVVSQMTGVSNVEEVSTRVLTPDLAERYVASVVATAGQDEMLIHRRRVTASSTLRQAKSVFCKWALANYSRHVQLPDSLTMFLQTGKSVKPRRYRIPPEHLRKLTVETAGRLKEAKHDLYATFCLAYDLGMRSGEIQAARWEWIETAADGKRFMRICRRPYWKGPKNLFDHSVPVADHVWDALQVVRTPDSEYILPGAHLTARKNLVNRDFSAWMRSVGWDRGTYPKAAHELRKLAGSMWYTKAGLQWAATWLGDTAATVDYFYSDLVTRGEMVDMRG
ncbi:MAG: tyrosine-type recombinase/integrase [Lentisphaerae bacterium]|nr:tyrosine-type recombinase/integrase [Lentisphaerota bacterium]